MDTWPGVDEALCEVYRKIVNGTTADLGGNGAQITMHVNGKRRLYMLELSATGTSPEDIAVKTGLSINTVRETIFGSKWRTK